MQHLLSEIRCHVTNKSLFVKYAISRMQNFVVHERLPNAVLRQLGEEGGKEFFEFPFSIEK